ncbi:prepilin peptidase [Trueperella sp.]|uniref:prepilin peptidase n=1 Tax=Trueperella sp. TaxID=2699835 RepID=UPI0022EAFD6D|nr:prepilin peptidase [Trueperella sp.]
MHPLLYNSMTNRQAALLVCASALTSVWVAGTVWAGQPQWWLPAVFAALFYPPLAINAVIDARHHVLLKNWTHLAGLIAVLAFVAAGAPWPNLLIGAAIALPMLAVSILTRGRLMGMGDARLIVVASLWNSIWEPRGALVMVCVSFALHVFYVLGRSLVAHVTLRSRHALGPWLVAGSFLAFTLA